MLVDADYFKCPCCLVEARPIDKDYCEECQELVDTAIQGVSIARRVGVPKYGPTSWRNAIDHLEHASRHVYRERIKNNPGITPDDEDHIAHAICRLVMAYALEEK